jgi:hypothetical protein
VSEAQNDPSYVPYLRTVVSRFLALPIVRLLTLHEVRGYLRRSHARGLAGFIAVAYALGSMLMGGMLILARFPGGYNVLILWGNALGLQPWNYPGLLIEAPWGFVILPFFATLSMVVVSAGVGLGMAVAILLGVQLVRSRRSTSGRPVASGTIAGLTPAMIALVTLGACCSTTAAATAGVWLVAQASGSSVTNLLTNNWFLGIFQIVVVYVALIAQELLLQMYRSLFAAGDPGYAGPMPASRPLDARAVAGGALRIALVAAGITWVLTVLADWTTQSPGSANAAVWFNWLVEHFLVGGAAVLVALAPQTVRGWLGVLGPSARSRIVRSVLLAGAWALGGWVPPPLAGAGIEGFGNELLGILGISSSWGAVSPGVVPGPVLAFQWGFQYMLLAGFAAWVSLSPRMTLDWLGGPDDASWSRPGLTEVVTAVPAPAGAVR